jgi:hypothetical protein
VGISIPRARKGGFKQTGISYTRSAAVSRQLLVVHCQHNWRINPDRLWHEDLFYFASSRRAARRFFMIFRAATIWPSNAGLYGVSR